MLALGAVFAFYGCSTTPTLPVDNDPVYQQAFAASRSQPPNDVKKYTGMREVNGKLFPSQCDYAGGSYHILLRLAVDGSVEQVIGREENRKTKCIRKAFQDVRFPAPPYAPFYLETCRGECP